MQHAKTLFLTEPVSLPFLLPKMPECTLTCQLQASTALVILEESRAAQQYPLHLSVWPEHPAIKVSPPYECD